jgi:hypothetical protein
VTVGQGRVEKGHGRAGSGSGRARDLWLTSSTPLHVLSQHLSRLDNCYTRPIGAARHAGVVMIVLHAKALVNQLAAQVVHRLGV